MAKLLIVDDSLIIRMSLEKTLGELNLQIVGAASDGKAALELFNEHKPDIVTLDITMPELDGLKVLDEIMRVAPETRVLIVSAISEKSVAIKALQKGAKAFIQKPYQTSEIISQIQKLAEEVG